MVVDALPSPVKPRPLDASMAAYSDEAKSRPWMSFRPRVATSPGEPLNRFTSTSTAAGVDAGAERAVEDMPVWASGSVSSAETDITPGTARSACKSTCCAASGWPCVVRELSITRTLFSSTPVTWRMPSTRPTIRKAMLQTMAQVMAICTIKRPAVSLWRRRLARRGWVVMAIPWSFAFQLQRRRYQAGPPGRQQARQDGRPYREAERSQQHRQVQVSQVGIVVGPLPNGPKTHHGQHQSQQPTADADGERLRCALRKDVQPAGAKRTADADLAAPAQELGHQKSDDVEYANGEKARREPQLQPQVAGNDVGMVQPLVQPVEPRAAGSLEPAALLLRTFVVAKVLTVAGHALVIAQLHPNLEPAAFATEVIVPRVGRVSPAIQVIGLHTQVDRRRQGYEHHVRLAKHGSATRIVVEQRLRMPGCGNADDGERTLPQTQLFPQGLIGTEQSAGQYLVHDNHARPVRHVILVQGATGTERNLKHGKEIGRDESGRHIGRLEIRLIGCAAEQYLATGHDSLAFGTLRVQECHRVDVGEIIRWAVLFLADLRHGTRVQMRSVQVRAQTRHGIARHDMQHGDQGHARPDAQADRHHQQDGDSRASAQTCQGKTQVISEHCKPWAACSPSVSKRHAIGHAASSLRSWPLACCPRTTTSRTRTLSDITATGFKTRTLLPGLERHVAATQREMADYRSSGQSHG